jgi:hypothetical protein
LDTWEKNVIGAMGFLALISVIGVFWSIKILNTVKGPAEGGIFQEVGGKGNWSPLNQL